MCDTDAVFTTVRALFGPQHQYLPPFDGQPQAEFVARR